MTPIVTLGIVLATAVALLLLQRTLRAGRRVALRPLPALDSLHTQLGQAIESGNPLHVTLGRASLVSNTAPTSVAALQLLDDLAEDGCANSTPPLVTAGDGTLLLSGQDSLRQAFQKAGRSGEFDPAQVQFIAAENSPYAYAAGAASVVQKNRVTANVAVGHFGPELAIIAEAANRHQLEQLLGTDDPTAMAIATAFTPNVLLGEELLATGAYVQENEGWLAALQLQDIVRWIVAVILVVLAIIKFLL